MDGDMTYEQLVDNLTGRKRVLYSVLRIGAENAIKSETISRRTGFSSKDIRFLIHQIICKDKLNISSNSEGYWIPISSSEIESSSNGLRGRGMSIMERAAALKNNPRYFPDENSVIVEEPQKQLTLF